MDPSQPNNDKKEERNDSSNDTSKTTVRRLDNDDGPVNNKMILANATSVAGAPLPAPHHHAPTGSGSLVLFYQYQEPPWTNAQHKHMLKDFGAVAQRFEITGRGRIAPEGLNCTLTCASPTKLRAFLTEIRTIFPMVFSATDFKITDGIPPSKLFKTLSLRKTEELVAFGMAGSGTYRTLETSVSR